MMLAGLKKCIPTTASGRFVTAAISLMSRFEVLEARMVPAGTIRSRSANTFFFRSMSSNTASTTRSAPAISARLVPPAIRAMRARASASDTRPLARPVSISLRQ